MIKILPDYYTWLFSLWLNEQKCTKPLKHMVLHEKRLSLSLMLD